MPASAHAHTHTVLPWRQEGCSVMELPCGPRQNGWGGDCVCWRATRAGQPQSPRGCFRLRQSSLRRFPAGGGLGLAQQHCSCRDESPPRVARDIRKQRDRVPFSDAPLLCRNVPPSSRLSATGTWLNAGQRISRPRHKRFNPSLSLSFVRSNRQPGHDPSCRRGSRPQEAWAALAFASALALGGGLHPEQRRQHNLQTYRP